MTREEAINYIKSSGVRIRMTRTEAINYLKSSGMSDKQIETVINAFTCDDCISRQDVMEIIECAYDKCKIDGYTDYCEMRDMVRGLPSVKPQESDDCISRQALLEKAIIVPIAKVVTEDKVICRKIVFVEDIQNLPSVTPKAESEGKE